MRKEIEAIALSNREYFTIQRGIAINPNSDMFWREGIRPHKSLPFVTPPDINSFEILTSNSSTRKNLNDEGVKHVQGKVIPPFSIICINAGPNCGKVCFTKVSCAISHYFFAIVVNDKNKLLPRYVFYMFKAALDQIRLMTKGAAVQHILRSELASLSIPLLNIERQTEIIEKGSNA